MLCFECEIITCEIMCFGSLSSAKELSDGGYGISRNNGLIEGYGSQCGGLWGL